MTYADAGGALYIDFECLKGPHGGKPLPALLGMLAGSAGECLEQLIVDERLKPARVADRVRTRFVPLRDAVETVIRRAVEHDAKIVGWSFFDRDRLVDARPDLEKDINARYVNAISVARSWRQKIYPRFRIEREDEFASKHTLDKYARLAEYPAARMLDFVESRPE